MNFCMCFNLPHHVFQQVLMWDKMKHTFLCSVFPLVKHALVSLKCRLKNETNGLSSDIKEKFFIANARGATGS